MSDFERMTEWVKQNPEAVARELIDMEMRISQAERRALMEEQFSEAAREEIARLKKLLDGMRNGTSGPG